jgi:DNA repair protein RadA/Sms
VKDPAVDAAICLALASASRDKKLPENLCVIGEVGLAGEVRNVQQQERRVKEILAMGYEVPAKNKDLGSLIRQTLR